MIKKNRLINVKIIRPYWRNVNFDCTYFSYNHMNLKLWVWKTSITFSINNYDQIYINDKLRIFNW